MDLDKTKTYHWDNGTISYKMYFKSGKWEVQGKTKTVTSIAYRLNDKEADNFIKNMRGLKVTIT